uniref:Uncharacterized protein n=1 Tax=Parascaris univalens TaxID=6257 RepID=A0A915AQ33_PARUN
ALKRAVGFKILEDPSRKACRLCPFSTDTACQLDIFRHNGHSFGVDGAKVGILEKTNEVRLTGLLERKNCRRLETQICFEILSDLSYKTLEGQFTDKKFRRFLITTNFTQSHRTWAVPMWFLHSSSSRCRLSSRLSRQLFPWSLASRRLTSRLFCTSHLQTTTY